MEISGGIKVTGTEKSGIVIVYTGEGKGKSSSAFGVMLRAVARGWSVMVIQFIKSEKWKTGERKMAEELGVDWVTGGDGFTWDSDDMEATARAARETWQVAQVAISGGTYDLVILDEATYPVSFGWIPVEEMVAALDARPEAVNIIITGRDADQAIIDAADTVTEMRKIKHAFDEGVVAKKGLDF
ncbi:MAG: cob(I)yrinic acid a,c-diamide adenosyltransferase [Acidobacteria bacterium]|nr:MAG: cob(I)yrinic acid a,c-diamide adenosyltransferase [Acidobacteriota bacterium]